MKLSLFRRFVPTSRMLYAFALILPFAAIVPIVSAVVPLFAFGLFFLIAIVDALMAANANVKVLLPGLVRLSKDRAGSIGIRIDNLDHKHKTIRIGLPIPSEIESESYNQVVALPEGAEFSRFEWACLPKKRGKFGIGHCFLEQQSLLGMWSLRTIQNVACEIRVYPNLTEERKKLAAQFLNRENYGAHARRMVGQGREFEKLREYVPGDAYDQLHWKATAKRGRPITKVFQMERTQEVYVALDFSRRSAREMEQETALEFFMRSALILGAVAQQQGDHFGVITFSNRVHGFLRAGNGRAHYHACRDMLYSLQPQMVTPDFEDLFSFARLKLRKRALLIILTDLNDPMLAESFVKSAALVARHHLLLVNMIRPQGAFPLFENPVAPSVDAVYEALSGHMVWENLKDLRNVLRRYGINLSQLHLPSMSVELVDQYFDVKSRQLL
jgi:uncharacterized protein (DUF58 family)